MGYPSYTLPGTKESLVRTLGSLCRGIDFCHAGRLPQFPAEINVLLRCTRAKRNSLSVASQDIVARAEGGLTITTYTNILDKDFWSTLPGRINSDKREFREFVRFKPEMKLKYVYFYADANNEELDQRFPDLKDKERAERLCDQLELNFSKFRSPEEMQDIEDLSEEGNRTVRVVERENGQKTFLRFTISAVSGWDPGKLRFLLQSNAWS